MEKKGFSSNAGQSVIEFVLGLMIVISFLFFYVKVSAVFAVGNYIHYATFMAARAFSSSAPTLQDQEDRAREVMSKTVLGKFKSLIAPKEGDGLSIGAGQYYTEDPLRQAWNTGVQFAFTSKVGLYPWSRKGQELKLDLVSESWMPRNVTEDEVERQRRKLEGGSVIKIPNLHVEWDNGL
jgi:Flp pilus assembly protein TadG